MSKARELIEQVTRGARPQDVTEGLIEVPQEVHIGDPGSSETLCGISKAKAVAGRLRVISKADASKAKDLAGGHLCPTCAKKAGLAEHGYMGFEGRNVEGRVLPSVPSGMMAMRGLGESVAQLDPKDYPGLQKANLAKLEAAHKALMDAYQGARRYLADLDNYQKHGGGDTFNIVGAHTKIGREVIENGGKAADAIVKVVHALRALELG